MTAFLPATALPVSPALLQGLLTSDAPADQCLGGGLRDALDLLNHSRRFYDMPAVLTPDLCRFELHLREALAALEAAAAKVNP